MNKEKKIGVSKITIQMGDKEATLTVEQAKELQAALNALLGEKIVERVVERDIYTPHNPYIPIQWWVYDCPSPSPTRGTITTTGDTGNYTITLNGGGDLTPTIPS